MEVDMTDASPPEPTNVLCSTMLHGIDAGYAVVSTVDDFAGVLLFVSHPHPPVSSIGTTPSHVGTSGLGVQRVGKVD